MVRELKDSIAGLGEGSESVFEESQCSSWLGRELRVSTWLREV
jgi:hypothetical protein